ncbi:MAG: inositol monophosphatase family protein [Gammaproteobacteria bacterium]|nr:inositol monophosphatase family protein [Gammaproteobacteria bacterium]
MSHHPLLNIAVRAARQAGNVIARNIDRFDAFAVSEKAANDFVTEIDRVAERRIIDTIRRSYPDHAFLAEESGAHGRHDFEWIIDPLDGTTNFVHGFPHVAVSIGVRHRGRMEHGVVFDPLRQELFTASRGSGAQLNDRRIRVATKGSLKGALIGSGFVTRELHRLESYLATLKAVMSGSAQIRRGGAAALDLAYVAAGRLDGFWEFGLAPWDIAAGTLLVQEAGGIVAEPNGGDDYIRTGDVAAANPKVLRAMLKAMGPPAPAARSPRIGGEPRVPEVRSEMSKGSS